MRVYSFFNLKSPFVYRAIFLVAVVVFGWVALRGIGNYWQWGHDGFNGAEKWNAARNSVRFGVGGSALHHLGARPPTPEDMQIRHPQMIHWHLTVLYALFGDHEWIARFVSAFYTMATLVLVYVAGGRLFSPLVGALASLIYVLIPLHLIYSNMVNHEQGGIFWTLAFVVAFLSWAKTQGVVEKPHQAFVVRNRRALLSLLFATCAMQFDYPAFYAAFFIALVAMGRAIAEGKRKFFVNRFAVYAYALSAVALLNAAFFAWEIFYYNKGFQIMINAFYFRTGIEPDYWEHTKEWIYLIVGKPFVWLLAAWCVLFLVRAATGRFRYGDAIIGCFFFAQCVSSTVFKNAGYVHIYWLYYVGIAVVFASADVITSVGTWLASKKPIMGWSFAALVAALVVGQATVARETYLWGIATGHASFKEPYDDQFDFAEWVKQVGKIYGGGNTVYFLHDPNGLFRIELYYYLDGEVRGTGVDSGLEDSARGLNRAVLLVDKTNPHNGDILNELMRRHRSVTWNNRFVAIELTSHDANRTDFISRQQMPSLFYKWLVNARHAPLTWVKTAHIPEI